VIRFASVPYPRAAPLCTSEAMTRRALAAARIAGRVLEKRTVNRVWPPIEAFVNVYQQPVFAY
jgi:hypothetical protein